ncbi:Uncharacterized phage-encoded protein [Candidatus Bartonella washoeensis]|uniref:Rha family transcriptional regulator n=1 Tax=Candidatus Bartonella washoeensis TaxID=186739 RepID=UPI000D9B3485|nr:Rha family transcriptional regulator [Bartonella washoeensis]SPU27063.1 Uncharacterized phage-encoded protein [Bartonella washoeensis]
MNNLVTINSAGIAVTTSLKIAKGVGNTHKTVIQLVRNNRKDFEEFGSLAFEMQVSRKDGKGGQKREIAILNESQATLLMTYMRNNDTVRAFKKALVKAFYELKSQSTGRDLFSTDNDLFSYESLKKPAGIGKVLGMIAARLSYVNDLQKELDHYKLVTKEAKRVLTNAIAKTA